MKKIVFAFMAVFFGAAFALAWWVNHAAGVRANSAETPAQEAREAGVRNVAILVYDRVELLDFAGPGEVFAAAGRRGGFRVYTVGARREPITSQGFVQVTPEFSIADAPRPDIVVIPGGGVDSVLNDRALMDWIRAASQDAEIMLSVCNGALVLAQAGLLDGIEATTHHGSLDALRRMAPQTRVYDHRRFVDNGKVITSAGVSAGIDSSLYVLQRLKGEDMARSVARYMEYNWQP